MKNGSIYAIGGVLALAAVKTLRKGASNKDAHRPHKTFNTSVEPHALYLEAWDHPTINISMMGESDRKGSAAGRDENCTEDIYIRGRSEKNGKKSYLVEMESGHGDWLHENQIKRWDQVSGVPRPTLGSSAGWNQARLTFPCWIRDKWIRQNIRPKRRR